MENTLSSMIAVNALKFKTLVARYRELLWDIESDNFEEMVSCRLQILEICPNYFNV